MVNFALREQIKKLRETVERMGGVKPVGPKLEVGALLEEHRLPMAFARATQAMGAFNTATTIASAAMSEIAKDIMAQEDEAVMDARRLPFAGVVTRATQPGLLSERVTTGCVLPNGKAWVRCAKCKGPVREIAQEQSPTSATLTFVFRCHGAVERATISMADVMNAKHVVLGDAFEE